jgi:membrane protease YdiL (CAAX protease family)
MRDRIKALSDRGEFVLVVVLCFGYYVATSLAALLMRLDRFELTTGRVTRGLAIQLVILAIAGWVLHVRGVTPAEITRRLTWKSVLAGVPLFLVYIVVYWSIAIAVLMIWPAAGASAMRMVPAAPIALIVAFILVNSFFEEAAVTGYVVWRLAPQGTALAISASVLLRFLYHLYQGPAGSLSILPLGLIFAYVYRRTHSIWPLVTAHTIANLFALVMAQART